MLKFFKPSMLLIFLSGTILILSGCFGNNYYNLTLTKLAEVRYNLYYGANDNIEVTLMSGEREKDYIINGYCTPPVEFGVLTFKILDESLELAETPMYVLIVGTTRYNGELEKNPFDGTYVADLKKIIKGDINIYAKILIGTFVEEVGLASATKNWKIDHNEALKIACKELKGQLTDFVENGEFLGEAYVKIINDKEFNKNAYYWYVNFVSREGKNIAVIIDPISKSILAKKPA